MYNFGNLSQQNTLVTTKWGQNDSSGNPYQLHRSLSPSWSCWPMRNIYWARKRMGFNHITAWSARSESYCWAPPGLQMNHRSTKSGAICVSLSWHFEKNKRLCKGHSSPSTFLQSNGCWGLQSFKMNRSHSFLERNQKCKIISYV